MSNIIQQIKEGKVEKWLHPKQQNGYISGHDIYKYLQDNDMVKDFLTLEDLEEIKKEGVEFVKKYLGNDFYYAWGSVRNRYSDLRVPSLYVDGDEVVLGWVWLGRNWDGSGQGLRNASLEPLKLEPKKVSETYEIDGHNVTISNGRISLKRKGGRQDFVFQNSTPETVTEVANILLEAVKLVK